MKFGFLALMGVVSALLTQSVCRAAIINFEDVAVSSGIATLETDVTSGGFLFNSQFDHAHLSHNYGFGVSNGTTMYTTDNSGGPLNSPITTTTMSKVGGATFTLNSLQIAEHDRNYGDATFVEITGNLFGGGTTTQIVDLDDTYDGTGPLNDFQTVVLNWTNLTSVVFRATAGTPNGGEDDRGFSLDNITVNDPVPAAVPEPATLTMFGLSALGFAGAAVRRRKLAA